MFFTKPNISFEQGWYKEPTAPDNPATAGEVFNTAWDASNRTELFGSSSRNLIDTYDAHNKRVEEITGKKFSNPAALSFLEFDTDEDRAQFYKDFGSYTADGGSLDERFYSYRWKEQNYRRKLAELAEQFPDYRDQLLPEMTFKERASAMARDSAAKAESAFERSGGGVLPQLSSIAGSAMSGLTDPINIITAPFGFGGVGTGLKGLAMGFLKTGASNAAVEAAVQPFVQADRNAAGMESGAAMGLANVGMAFAFGGALDLGIRGTARGLRWSLGYEPVVKDGIVVGYKKIAPDKPADPAAPTPAAPAKAGDTDPTFIPKDLIDRADAEDQAAMRAVAERSGLINDPLVRTTFDAMDANERMIASRPSETIADGEHARGIVQTLRHVNDPELEPLPAVRDGTTLDTIRGLDLEMAAVRAELRMLKERAPADAEGLARLEARVAEISTAKIAAQREIMADDLIAAVDQGRVPQELADLVVDHVADKAIHGRVASDLAKMRPTSPTEARHRLAQILSSPDYRPEVPAVPARGNGLARPALDDPYGTDAKAQVASLEKELAQELDAAGVKREGAAAEGKAESGGEAAAKPSFRDPVTGEKMTSSDVDAIVDMWRYVAETKKRKPETLTAFIMRTGRLQDQDGEITRILGGKNRQLISGNGSTLDDAALRATEQGFFAERPDISAFLDAIDDDVRGNMVVRIQDYDKLDDYRVAQQMEEDLDRLGIAGAKNENEVRRYFVGTEGQGDEGPRGLAEAFGRSLENAERQAARLEEGTFQSLKTDEATRLELMRRIESGDYDEAEFYRLKDIVDSAIARVVARLPHGTQVKTMLTPDDIEGGFTREDGIFVSLLALHPEAIITHEEVHALRNVGTDAAGKKISLFTDSEWRILVNKANKLGIKDQKFLQGKRSISELYPEKYGDRFMVDGKLDKAALDNVIDEEAVAYMRQRRVEFGEDYGAQVNSLLDRITEFLERLRNFLAGDGFQSVDDVYRRIDSGEVGQRARAANEVRRQAVRSFMEAEDLTAVAVRQQPMYAIGKDPGFTDRVRSLLDWAFGLDQMPATADELLKVAREATRLEQQVGRMRAELAGGDMMQRAANDGGELDAYEIAVLNKTLRGSNASPFGVVEGGVSTEGKAKKFFDVGFKKSDGGSVSLTSAYEHYAAWAETTGAEIVSLPTFSRMISDQGFTKQLIGGRVRLIGIELNNDALPSNIMFAFAGERAKTADLNALDLAKRMTLDGADRTEVWTRTGWFQGVDGKWRFEIDDSGMRMTARTTRGGALADVSSTMKMGGIIDHPELLRAYPELENLKVKQYNYLPGRGIGSNYWPDADPAKRSVSVAHDATRGQWRNDANLADPNEIMMNTSGPYSLRSTGVHELQHAIQEIDGALPPKGLGPRVYSTAAEVEARTVEKRMDLSAAERRARPPWLDYDVPEDQQIVRFADGVQNSEPMFAIRQDQDTGRSMRRDLDALGYYSGALEAAKGLKQAKGTPEQMLAQLKAGGAKQAELDATNLAAFLDGKTSVTRDEIVDFLEKNRVGVKEKTYADAMDLPSDEKERRRGQDVEAAEGAAGPTKWSSYSLDPSNPTYRETVIHLPDNTEGMTIEERFTNPDGSARLDTNFQSGHFPEPNIIGHMMTSMTRHDGKPVFTIDQIQSDWGQKIRDGGARDDAKIAQLKGQLAVARDQFRNLRGDTLLLLIAGRYRSSDPIRPDLQDAINRLHLVEAELRTAEAAPTSHPLISTTDQWTNTTLRRAIRQAAEADADYIAIPHGDTVLSYNPGDVDGMRGFYGSRTSEGIVPKNLRKILEKLDKNAAKPQRVEAVETSDGVKGWNTAEKYPFDKEQTGFTLFPLTPEVKDRVLSEGQPLFAMRQDNGRKTPGSDSRKQYVKEDFDAIDAQFQKAGGDERLKLQAKRAALLNAKAHEKVSADIAVFQDVGGQTDPGKAMMFVVENQGQATFQGLATMRDIATQTDLAEMGKMMWQMRKGAVLGDKRRGTAPVKTMLHNVIREAWGQNTGDATAKEFAKALLSRMEARRQRWNHAGGDIKKLEGYAGPQYHDREAWASAGREEIVKYFVENDVLDRSRMISFETGAPMTDAELSDMLKGVWRNVVSDGAAAFEEGASASAGRPGAKYKQRMEHRVLHFKDADAWLAYNEKYGSGDVYASIVGEAITMNRDIALMERLGANPLLTWERLKADVIREAQNAVASKSLYDEFMGKIEDLRAKRAAIPNAFESLNAKLTKDMEALDQLRDESRTSKRKAFRNRPKIAELTRGLRETVLAIEEALKNGAQTAEQIAITTEIADLMAEMVDAGARNSMSRNPVERVQRLVKRADEMMKSYMGSANVPADDRLAAGMTATRNLLGASTLVYAPFSALADQTTQAMARLLTGLPLKSQITSYVKAFTKMDRQFALDTAIGLESVLPAVHESNRYVGSLNARHISGYVADRSHAFSFLSPMTTAAKIAFSFDFMKDFASIRGTPYTELGEIKQTLLDRHGISPAEWDQIRAAEPEMHRGREHLTHRAIAAAAGPELADKYLGMLYRERSYSTIEGLTRGRTAFVSDMQPGTAQGEALRSIAMFKSFPVSYGMLIFGRLYEEVMKGRAMQPSVIGAAASIFIGGTILGALVIQLKQIAQGKDPRDMTDPKFWAQAFMQSGGLGIYGDFVASSINRQGSGLAGTIAGPVADLGGNVLDLTFGNVAQYASDEKTNAGREAVKLMRRLTPGMIAPWYIRTAVDRMVFDELQKVLDPEAHRSFQSRMRTTKKVGGNDFFWAPGTSEPQRGPNMGAIFGR